MHFLKTFVFLASLLGTGFFIYRRTLTPQFSLALGLRPLAVIPVIALGLFSSSIWVYYGSILFSAVFIPRSRADAVSMYLFLSFLLPQVPYDLKVGAVYITKLEGTLFASIGLLTAARFPVTNTNLRTKEHLLGLLAVVFMALQISVDVRSGDLTPTSVARSVFEVVLSTGVPFMAMSSLMKERIDSRLPLLWFSAIGTILAWVAAFEMLRHWPLYQTIQSSVSASPGLSKTLAVRGGLLRSPGPFFESTTFGLFLALTTILSASIPAAFRNRASYLLVVAIGLFGCFSTLSRNSWVGVTIGLLAVGLFKGRIAKSVGFATLLALGFAIVTLGTSDSGLSADLLGKGTSHAASTGEYRERLWTESIALIRKSPWIGTPYNVVAASMPPSLKSGSLKVDYVNSYLYFAVTSGLFGVIVFIVFLLAPALKLYGQRARVSSGAASGLFSALIALAVMVFGTSFFERIPLMAIMLVSAARLLAQMIRSGPAKAATSSGNSSLQGGLGIEPDPQNSSDKRSRGVPEINAVIVDSQDPTSRVTISGQ